MSVSSSASVAILSVFTFSAPLKQRKKQNLRGSCKRFQNWFHSVSLLFTDIKKPPLWVALGGEVFI
jgi:hypothetical protein